MGKHCPVNILHKAGLCFLKNLAVGDSSLSQTSCKAGHVLRLTSNL